MSVAELKNALVHGSEMVVTISYVYAGVLIVVAFVKVFWKK
jgi:hypothetical protein